MKKPYHFFIPIAIVISLFNACKPNCTNAIEDSEKKYPDLYKDNPANSFSVIRSLTDEKLKITMKLFQSGYQQIVVLSDSLGRTSSIPFPDNDYCSYWQFCPDSMKTHRYFKTAVTDCLGSLALKRNWNKFKVIDDILVSLIKAEPLTSADTTLLRDLVVGNCGQDRVKNNQSYQTIIKSMKTAPSYWNYSTYSDLMRARIYQIDIVNDSVVVNAYKRPCFVTHLLRL